MVVAGRPDRAHRVRGVGQLRVLEDAVCHVHPQPRDAAVQPEPDDVLEHRRHPRVAPVPVRLPGVEQVQVPLPVRHPAPGGAAEVGRPVVRRQVPAGSAAFPEDEQIPLRAAGRGRQRRLEQRVRGGAVVGHQVDDHPHAVFPGARDEFVEAGERAEPRVDVAVVAHVVAAVGQRRRVEGREPERVDAEFCQIGQPGRQPVQVTDAVAVAVGEAARVDLVHHRVRPPGVVVSEHGRQPSPVTPASNASRPG